MMSWGLVALLSKSLAHFSLIPREPGKGGKQLLKPYCITRKIGMKHWESQSYEMDKLGEVTIFQVDAMLLGSKGERTGKELKRGYQQHGARVVNLLPLPRKPSFYVKPLSRKS